MCFFRRRRIPAPPPTPPTPPPTPPTPPDTDTISSLLALHNYERARKGLVPLKLDQRLVAAAQTHSDWQAEHRTMTHDGDGTMISRISAAGYRYTYAGENVGAGYATPQAVVEGWMSSSGHRANILGSNFRDVGFGVASAGSVRYWTSVFAASMVVGAQGEDTSEVTLSGPIRPTQ